jgi:hypothetical protein
MSYYKDKEMHKAELTLSPTERASVIITESNLMIESYLVWSHLLDKWIDVDLDKLFVGSRKKYDELYLAIEKKLQGEY